MRALIVQQDHVSPIGPVGEALAACGYHVEELLVVPAERFHAPDVEVTFPDPTAYDVVVPMGAPWSVYDEATIGRWVGAEIDFLRRAHEAAVPVLAICFGGQALAAALGGSVERAPEPEIGWYSVETDEPELIPAGPWFQWHHDRWTAPPGSRELARTSVAPQAFTVGRSLAVQFHPELTEAMLAGWLGNGGSEHLRALGLPEGELVERTRREAPAAAARTRSLVHQFLDRVATPLS